MSSSQTNAKVCIAGADTFHGQAILCEWAKINPSQVRQIHAIVNSQNNGAQHALKSLGVGRVTSCDYQSESKISQELKDCDYVVICPPVSREYNKQQACMTAQAAKQARVQNAVVLSMVGVDASRTSEAFKNCHQVESYVKQNCDNSVILRMDMPAQFIDFCVPMMQQSNYLKLNAGDGRWAPLDLADAAKALSQITKNKSLEGNLKGQVFQLTGPTAVDGNQVAQCIRKATNSQKPQGYQNVNRQEVERELNNIYQHIDQQRGAQGGMETRQQPSKVRGSYDIPETILEKPSIDNHKQTISVFMDCCDLVQQNSLTTVTKDVQQITRNQPNRLEDYFKRESQVYARLM